MRRALKIPALAVICLASGTAHPQMLAPLKQTLDAWSAESGVVLTDEARELLANQVNAAVDAVSARRPATDRPVIQEKAVLAARDVLRQSRATGKSATVEALLESHLLGGGAPFGYPTDYPILIVDITPDQPKNFQVTLNGKNYGSQHTFSVVKGTKAIVVQRPGKTTCSRTIEVRDDPEYKVLCAM